MHLVKFPHTRAVAPHQRSGAVRQHDWRAADSGIAAQHAQPAALSLGAASSLSVSGMTGSSSFTRRAAALTTVRKAVSTLSPVLALTWGGGGGGEGGT